MIVVSIQGGLGNQLQQYALYRKYISMGIDARVDLSWFDAKSQAGAAAKRKVELDYFPNVNYQVCTEAERNRLIGGLGFRGKVKRKLASLTGVKLVKIYHESSMYDDGLLKLRDCYLDGYFANEYYYNDILGQLKKELVFPVDKSKNKDLIQEYASKMQNENSVSVHLRRGDYLDEINQSLFGGICTDDYYASAIERIKRSVDNPVIYIFSDDRKYAREYAVELCKQGVKASVIDINYGDESFYDIYLMSKCRHHITANSTFSFWGARLSDTSGIKIRPTKQKNSQEFCDEMYNWWSGWIFVSPEGEELN